MLRLEIRFHPGALARAHDGLDLEATARAYADALREALARELPGAELDVRADGSARGLRATASGVDEAEARAAERTARDVAWVVDQMVPYAVLSDG